ncbi:hypothetical protein GO730_02140 [Spirosoma sp. HMF3257]|uniref:Uncharacterized protein n=1 Tax=Spirosoma telluris TaxID=2183553 RepID=A0A327NHM8_9BACT|nr:hypothetical protein [Spirosoma telluris]RAI73516.1 hypothetical protein HMF3257_02090 [Spirosoma telluris]
MLSPPEKTDRTKLVNAILLHEKPTSRFRRQRVPRERAGRRTEQPAGHREVEGTNYLGLRITRTDR